MMLKIQNNEEKKKKHKKNKIFESFVERRRRELLKLNMCLKKFQEKDFFGHFRCRQALQNTTQSDYTEPFFAF
jgi:hypothetical protein